METRTTIDKKAFDYISIIIASDTGEDEKCEIAGKFLSQMTIPDFINTARYYGVTGLHIAASRGFIKLASLMLSFHANINAVDEENRTALHDAVESDHHDMVLWFCYHGIHANIITKNKETALHIAIKKGHVRCVETLLDCGNMDSGILQEIANNINIYH